MLMCQHSIRRKHTRYLRPKTCDCVLCCQEYQAQTPIVECKFCHQNLHLECQGQWIVHSILCGQESTCPFCRQHWMVNDYIYFPILV
jgi:hypothetical protein|uniref:RING-type domain-containing protein n=1 Tax=viral metagenome TaxID=1070528 RepID=A0A6C0BMM3_9ZZZZ